MRHYNVANFSKTFTGETLLRKIYFVFLNICSKQTVIKESCSRIKKWTLQILDCLHCSKMLPVCCDKHMMLTLFCIHFRGEKNWKPSAHQRLFFFTRNLSQKVYKYIFLWKITEMSFSGYFPLGWTKISDYKTMLNPHVAKKSL